MSQYEIIPPTATLNGDTAVITGGSTRDGKPHHKWTHEFFGTSRAEFDDKRARAANFVKGRKLKGLSYDDLLDFQDDAAHEVKKWGREHKKKGKGK